MADGLAITQTDKKVAVIWPGSVKIARDDIENQGWSYVGLGGGPNLLFEKRKNGKATERMRWNAKTGMGAIIKEKE